MSITSALKSVANVPCALALSSAALLVFTKLSDHRTLRTQRSRLYEALTNLEGKRPGETDEDVSQRRAEALDYLLNVYMDDTSSGFTREDEKSGELRRLICVDFGAIEKLIPIVFDLKEDPVVMRRCCETIRRLIKPMAVRSRNGLCRKRLFGTGVIEQLLYHTIDTEWPIEVRVSAALLLRRATYYTWFTAHMERDEIPHESKGSLDIVKNVSDEDLQKFIDLTVSLPEELQRMEDAGERRDVLDMHKQLLTGVMGTIAHISETTVGAEKLLRVGTVDAILPHLQSRNSLSMKHAAVILGNICITDFDSVADKFIAPTTIKLIMKHLESGKRQTSALNCVFSIVRYLSMEGDDEEENEYLRMQREMVTKTLYECKENVAVMLGLMKAQRASTRETAFKFVAYITQSAFSSNHELMQEVVELARKREQERIARKQMEERRRQQQQQMMMGGGGGMDPQMMAQLMAMQGGGGGGGMMF